jgi:hypothetical protein
LITARTQPSESGHSELDDLHAAARAADPVSTRSYSAGSPSPQHFGLLLNVMMTNQQEVSVSGFAWMFRPHLFVNSTAPAVSARSMFARLDRTLSSCRSEALTWADDSLSSVRLGSFPSGAVSFRKHPGPRSISEVRSKEASNCGQYPRT